VCGKAAGTQPEHKNQPELVQTQSWRYKIIVVKQRQQDQAQGRTPYQTNKLNLETSLHKKLKMHIKYAKKLLSYFYANIADNPTRLVVHITAVQQLFSCYMYNKSYGVVRDISVSLKAAHIRDCDAIAAFLCLRRQFHARSVHTLAIVGLCNVASEFSWFCDACDRVGLNSTLSRHCSVQVVMDSTPGTKFSVGVVYFLFADVLGH